MPKQPVSLLSLLLAFLKIGAFTFGGGYAILPAIQKEAIDNHKWVDQATFADILIITQSMPGQLALNSAIQIGIKMRGIPGGLIAAFGVTAPSVLIILTVAAFFFPIYRDNIYVQAAFYGLRPAVVAMIAGAAVRMGRDILCGRNAVILCAALLIAAVIFQIHPIAFLTAGGLLGLLVCKRKMV
ncbi:MAG TPA: chromate transporter [Candidatus Limnocylindrales bacterium]|nr:chromate transporter [Candidatus Limnocylindrales bacterium]